ncbi:MAG: apolipoprotein N-acyltransferase [Spirochaetes bacterium]|nr:apolipoprotein N-acyltransferase [Spirochaetota bacterium]
MNLAPLLSSALYAACFPSTPVSLIVFIALVPFFVFLSKTMSLKKTCAGAATFGAFSSLIIAYWIFNALYFHYRLSVVSSLLFLGLIVILPMALIYVIFACAFRFLYRDSVYFFACVIPSLWVVCEFLRDILPFYLPWGFAGYSLSAFTPLIQIADVVGVYGISFCIIAVNSLCAHAWLRSEIGKHGRIWKRLQGIAEYGKKNIVVIGIILSAMIIYGAIQKHRWDIRFSKAPHTDAITIRVVQGSFAHRDRWDSSNAMVIAESLLKLTGELDANKRFLAVWPETVINACGSLRDAIVARIINAIGENNLLIFGGTRQGENAEMYNSAYFVSGRGSVKVYDKIILLPFAETTPWSLNIFGNFYEAPTRFHKGRLPSVASLNGISVGFSICFEKIFSWFMRTSVLRGATLLVNISNDSWFGRSTNPYQNLDVAIMRAVENRRYMAVASNSGISAVITPTGTCAVKSGLFTEEVIETEAWLENYISLYTKYGNLVLCAAVAILVIYIIFFIIFNPQGTNGFSR